MYPAKGNAFLFKEGGMLAKSVGNMAEFFIKNDFGKKLVNVSSKTNFTEQGQSVFKVTSKNNNLGLKKGDHYYLDNKHKDHLEVFDSSGNFKQSLNLEEL